MEARTAANLVVAKAANWDLMWAEQKVAHLVGEKAERWVARSIVATALE